MGSSAPTQKFGSSDTVIRPNDQASLDQALQGYQSAIHGATNATASAANNYKTSFGQFNPNLRTEYAGPQFSNGLDAFSQNLISQGTQAANQQLGAQQQLIAQKFGGQNPGLSQILQSQAAAQSQLGQNPAYLQAATLQQQREAQGYQLGQQAQELTNQARLAQAQTGAANQTAGNAALAQQAQLFAAPVDMQQTLAGVLAAIAALQGTQRAYPTGTDPNAPQLGPLGSKLA